MDAIITALTEILEAQTGTGLDLAGAEVTDEENELPKGGYAIVVSPVDEQFQGKSNFAYESVRGIFFITVMIRVDKLAANRYRAAAQTAKAKAPLIRKTIMASPTLICTTYPSGLIEEHRMRFTGHTPGYGAEDGVWYAFSRQRLEVDYVYRNGIISLIH